MPPTPSGGKETPPQEVREEIEKQPVDDGAEGQRITQALICVIFTVLGPESRLSAHDPITHVEDCRAPTGSATSATRRPVVFADGFAPDPSDGKRPLRIGNVREGDAGPRAEASARAPAAG